MSRDQTIDFLKSDLLERNPEKGIPTAATTLLNYLKFSENEALLGVAYGLHNDREAFAKGAKRFQFTNYLLGVLDIIGNEKPALIVTANAPKDYEYVLENEFVRERLVIFDPNVPLAEGWRPQNGKVYMLANAVSTPEQIDSVVRLSNIPNLFEGDSSISSAIISGKPFVMLRSGWNHTSIQGWVEMLQKVWGEQKVREITQSITQPILFDSPTEVTFLTPDLRKIKNLMAPDALNAFHKLSRNQKFYSDGLFNAVETTKFMVEIGKTENPMEHARKISDPVLRVSTIVYLYFKGKKDARSEIFRWYNNKASEEFKILSRLRSRLGDVVDPYFTRPCDRLGIRVFYGKFYSSYF